jgi:hypothetical protein
MYIHVKENFVFIECGVHTQNAVPAMSTPTIYGTFATRILCNGVLNSSGDEAYTSIGKYKKSNTQIHKKESRKSGVSPAYANAFFGFVLAIRTNQGSTNTAKTINPIVIHSFGSAIVYVAIKAEAHATNSAVQTCASHMIFAAVLPLVQQRFVHAITAMPHRTISATMEWYSATMATDADVSPYRRYTLIM